MTIPSLLLSMLMVMRNVDEKALKQRALQGKDVDAYHRIPLVLTAEGDALHVVLDNIPKPMTKKAPAKAPEGRKKKQPAAPRMRPITPIRIVCQREVPVAVALEPVAEPEVEDMPGMLGMVPLIIPCNMGLILTKKRNEPLS